MKFTRRQFTNTALATTGLATAGVINPAFADRNDQMNILCWEGYNSDGVLGPFRKANPGACLLYTSPSPRDATLSRMASSA